MNFLKNNNKSMEERNRLRDPWLPKEEQEKIDEQKKKEEKYKKYKNEHTNN